MALTNKTKFRTQVAKQNGLDKDDKILNTNCQPKRHSQIKKKIEHLLPAKMALTTGQNFEY